jgi:biotin transport system ATP-binding protein/energy-coupling factor transport system ATP-binding protein
MKVKELIQVQNLLFHYNQQQPVLKNLNLTVGSGEFLALIGPNGCGKTTFIRHLNALLRPTGGDVRIGGLSTRNPENIQEVRRRVGMVFQNPDNQFVGMSVEEDVAFGPGNLGLSSAEIRRRVDQALEAVNLAEYRKHPPYTLSGGQKQLLALAGLLAMDPQIIVLDEPTSSLDPAGKRYVLELLQKLKQQGICIILVTHNMDEAALADRVVVMEQGMFAADGKAADILCRVEWLKSLDLAPPTVTELMWLLRQKGEDVNPRVFTAEDALQEISVLLERLRLRVERDG